MNPSTIFRRRHAAVLVIVAALASTLGFGGATVSGQEPLPEACAMQERSPNYARAVDPNCASDAEGEVVTCSYYEDVHGRIRVVHESDQYCLSYAAVEASRIEAAGWPDYDSTAISDPERNIAIDRATAEAAGWPDYDSTAISDPERNIAIDVAARTAANSPRMTQIAAQAGSGDTVASRSNPFVL